jgi:hypothetical protein
VLQRKFNELQMTVRRIRGGADFTPAEG